jgi:hypothetical protein
VSEVVISARISAFYLFERMLRVERADVSSKLNIDLRRREPTEWLLRGTRSEALGGKQTFGEGRMRRKMRAVKRVTMFGFGAALLSMGYSNCAPAQFQDALGTPSVAQSGETGNSVVVPNTPSAVIPPNVVVPGSANPNVTPVKEACTGVMRETVVPIVFGDPAANAADPANICRFNQGDNGDLINDHFSARVEQNVDFALPSGAKICNMEFQFNEQTITYDDHIFFVFDDALILASSPFDMYLPYSDGIFNWNWASVVGQPWKFGNETSFSYCLGEKEGLSSCRFPQTQMEGAMKLDFNPALFQAITARNLNRPVHQFKFVTMGDNDPQVDCRHSSFSFNVKVRWAQ